jgi:hypothetical protein
MANRKAATAAVQRFLCVRGVKIGAIAVLAMGLAGTAKADLIFSGTGTGSDGSPISAMVDFSLTGSTFQIVLTNNDVANSHASVLTNVGFDAVPTPATALPSASGVSGSNRWELEGGFGHSGQPYRWSGMGI